MRRKKSKFRKEEFQRSEKKCSSATTKWEHGNLEHAFSCFTKACRLALAEESGIHTGFAATLRRETEKSMQRDKHLKNLCLLLSWRRTSTCILWLWVSSCLVPFLQKELWEGWWHWSPLRPRCNSWGASVGCISRDGNKCTSEFGTDYLPFI